MRLYWRHGTAAMAPHAALAEIGAGYELVLVALDDAGGVPPEYLAVNPSGLVPSLQDGETVVTESAAIMLHLADRHPEARLAPVDRAGFYPWLIFLTNSLQTALSRQIYPDRYGGGDVRAAADAEAQRHFDRIEAALAGREWLVGEHRTAADLYLFMLTRWGRHLASPAWDRPNLRAHFIRTLALPGVRRMIDEQDLELPSWSAGG